jgi:catechol 2,3-dioxygenase-like lactoylglutathione lyase family enzyme
MTVRRIGHIGLIARDLDRMVDFYCDVLGFKLSDRHSFPATSAYREGAWLRCDTDHHAMSMFDLRTPPDEPSTRATTGLHHFAFEMPCFEALQHAARLVRELGLPLQGQRTGGPGNQLRLYFWDPEDNIIELYWEIDQVGSDGHVREYPPIVDIDLETFDAVAWLESKQPAPAGSALRA